MDALSAAAAASQLRGSAARTQASQVQKAAQTHATSYATKSQCAAGLIHQEQIITSGYY